MTPDAVRTEANIRSRLGGIGFEPRVIIAGPDGVAIDGAAFHPVLTVDLIGPLTDTCVALLLTEDRVALALGEGYEFIVPVDPERALDALMALADVRETTAGLSHEAIIAFSPGERIEPPRFSTASELREWLESTLDLLAQATTQPPSV